jgi:hypothetical protein
VLLRRLDGVRRAPSDRELVLAALEAGGSRVAASR